MVRTDIVSVIVQWYDNWFSSTVQWYSAWYGDIVIFAAGQYRTVQYHNSATCIVYDSGVCYCAVQSAVLFRRCIRCVCLVLQLIQPWRTMARWIINWPVDGHC